MIVVGVVMLVKAAIAFGTGLLADDPEGKMAPPRRRRWPPAGTRAARPRT
ncbi:hypothetical protein NKG05_06620 [Oerskovia sp. M15]